MRKSMKHKLTMQIIKSIIDSEMNFRPRQLTARLLKIDTDTINNWIAEGNKLLTEREVLFPFKKENFENFSEEEKLMYLAESINQIQLISQTMSWDNYITTGKKDSLKMFLTKEAIRLSPNDTVSIAVESVNLFEKNDTPIPPAGTRKRNILSQEELKTIEEKKKKG